MAAKLNLPEGLEAELTDLVARGLKIAAVRRCREVTGADLATAVEAVERLRVRPSPATVIWFPTHRRAFFAVPVGHDLPPGTLELHNVAGEVVHTDISALAAFSISPAAAASHIGRDAAQPAPRPQGPHRFDGAVVGWADHPRIARRLIELLAPHLSPSQLEELEDYHRDRQWLLVAEFGTQFLDDNQGRLDDADFRLVSEGRVALGGYPLDEVYRSSG